MASDMTEDTAPTSSSLAFWQSRYEAGDTPWDKGAPSPGLTDFVHLQPLTGQVLVPGCGSGHDVRMIAARSAAARVTGLDIAPGAVRLARNDHANPPNTAYETADFLALPERFHRRFDWVVEHTLFCAIDPGDRARYARSVADALRPGGHFLAVFYRNPERDDEDGPPHGCSEEELDGLFGTSFVLLRQWVPDRNYESRIGREIMRLMRRAA